MNIAVNRESRLNNNIFKIITRIRKSGNLRKTSYLHKLASKGLFYQVGEKQAEKFATTIDSMITVLNSNFGETWDFMLEEKRNINGKLRFSLITIIHYPLINLTNKYEKHHTIKDLFVVYEIKSSGDIYEDDESGLNLPEEDVTFHPSHLTGTRGSLTFEEWFSGYQHSHLPSWKIQRNSNTFTCQNFCVGLGEVEELRMQLCTFYTPEIFELFCMTLETLVSWESIEGVPHMYISEITTGKMEETNCGENHNAGDYISSKAYTSFRRHLSSLPVNLVLSEEKYKIKKNDGQLEKCLKHALLNQFGSTSSMTSALLTIEKEGLTYGYSSPDVPDEEEFKTQFNNIKGELSYTLIRNEKIEFKVDKYDGELPDINKFNINKNYLNYAAKQLEAELYEKTIRRSAIKAYYSS